MNDIFTGGALVVAGGFLLRYLKVIPDYIGMFVKRHFTVVLDVTDDDVAFKWVERWISERGEIKSKLLNVKTYRDTNESRVPKYVFVAAPGKHFLNYKGKWCLLEKQRHKPEAGIGQTKFHEQISIRFFTRDKSVIDEFVSDCRDVYHPQDKQTMTIRIPYHSGWEELKDRPTRNFDTVCLPTKTHEMLINDVSKFLNSRDWYRQMGIPHRRGYLFHGPPGNGKGSTVVALASEFNLDLGVCNISDRDINDSSILSLINDTPPHSITLFEDIDCVVKDREVDSNSLSFSGLLNALDGVSTPEGQIIVMTTNHPQNLDDALIRPGRCDIQIEFCNANFQQASEMFRRFYGITNDEFAKIVSESEVSMAKLQGHLIKYRNNLEQALSHIGELLE